jgi:hypothetical protein
MPLFRRLILKNASISFVPTHALAWLEKNISQATSTVPLTGTTTFTSIKPMTDIKAKVQSTKEDIEQEAQ